MRIDFGFLRWLSAVAVLAGLGQAAGCTTGDNDTPGQGGAGGSTGGSGTLPGGNGGTAGTPAGTGGSTTSAGLACAKQTVITKPGIANFDSYDGSADPNKYSFSLGDDSSTGILAGTFGYGDRTNNVAEAFGMTAGHSPLYALRVADSMSQVYGGGMGIWLSGCLDARAFSGISFWVHGVAPTGTAKVSLMMKQTTSSTPLKAEYKAGTCPGVQDTTCIHPKNEFEVPSTFQQVKIPWAAFTGGKSPDSTEEIKADGSSIWQVQFDIGLQWTKDATDTYVPVPGAYELVVDDVAFY